MTVSVLACLLTDLVGFRGFEAVSCPMCLLEQGQSGLAFTFTFYEFYFTKVKCFD